MTFSPEVQEILDRVMRGEPKPKPKRGVKKSYYKPTGKPRGENLKNREPSFDYQKIVELHLAKYKQAEIAMELGCSEQTVRKALKKAFPEGYVTYRGPQRKEYCAYGHNDWKHYNSRPQDRYCATCMTKYTRDRYREKHGIPLDAPVQKPGERCPKDHEPNWEYNKRGHRNCITCRRERQNKRSEEAKKARKAARNGM